MKCRWGSELVEPVRKANTKMPQRTKKRVTNWSSYTAPAHYPSNEPALNRNINMPLFVAALFRRDKSRNQFFGWDLLS